VNAVTDHPLRLTNHRFVGVTVLGHAAFADTRTVAPQVLALSKSKRIKYAASYLSKSTFVVIYAAIKRILCFTIEVATLSHT